MSKGSCQSDLKNRTQANAEQHPFRGSLHSKKICTGDPTIPEEVRLAKQVKWKIGNKAAIGDVEEHFELEEVEFGETQANPNPTPADCTDPAPVDTALADTLPVDTLPSLAPTAAAILSEVTNRNPSCLQTELQEVC